MQRRTAEQISYELLAPYFQESLDVVAQKVGLSKAALKAACKKLGIDKWPAGNGTPQRRQSQTHKESYSGSSFPGTAPGNFMLPHSSSAPGPNGYHMPSSTPFSSAQHYPSYFGYKPFAGAGSHSNDPSSNTSYSQLSAFGSFSARPTPPGPNSAHPSPTADGIQTELSMPTEVQPPNQADLEGLLALTSKPGAAASLNIGAASWTVDSEDLQFLFKVASKYRSTTQGEENVTPSQQPSPQVHSSGPAPDGRTQRPRGLGYSQQQQQQESMMLQQQQQMSAGRMVATN